MAGGRSYIPNGGQVVAWAAFTPATAAIIQAQWLAVALTTASQQWTLTIDPEAPCGLVFTRANGDVGLRTYIKSTSGLANARVAVWSINTAGSGSALLESIDTAGALANAVGTVMVEVVLFGGLNS